MEDKEAADRSFTSDESADTPTRLIVGGMMRPAPMSASPAMQHIHGGHDTLLPPPAFTPGRRVSIASGEINRPDTIMAKRHAAMLPSEPNYARGLHVPQNQASMARRGSIPYAIPSGQPAPTRGAPSGSPNISPALRAMPSALHLAALRNNNNRRGSMPGSGSAQLLASGAFVPPRNVSGSHAHATTALSTIKDDSEPPMANPTQPHLMTTPFNLMTTTYTPSDSSYPGPLPNPAFSFGAAPDDDFAIAAAVAARGRMGSIASIGTFTTDGGTTEAGSEFSSTGEWSEAWGMDMARRQSA